MASNFATGFLTGFMNDQATKISTRKSEAESFFNEQMKMAQKLAIQYKTQNDPRMDAALQTAKQMMAVGVPQSTVMAIVNQNPDDLPTFLETIQKMKMEGVDMSNPDIYDSMLQIDGEFNPGNENVTSLIKRIYDPLTSNAKADPEGFDFDPKGTMWASLLGYNAMEKSYERLAKSEVLPGVSASAVLAMGGQEDRPLPHPLGDSSVVLDAGVVGDLTRQARSATKGTDFTIAERRAVLDTFNDLVDSELTMLSAPDGADMSPEERRAEASRRAAAKVIVDFPEALQMTEIGKWINRPETEMPSESPPAAPTAPSAPSATPAPVAPTTAATALPTSAEDLGEPVQDLGDSVVYMKNGVPTRYAKSFIRKLTGGTNMQSQPTPGWLDRLGSEYD